MIFALFGDKKKGEAKQLNRDVYTIIEQAKQLYSPKRLCNMAETVADLIARAHLRYGTSEVDLKRAHFDYRGLHKEARQKNDQVRLSAMTLVIIYIRAEIAGPGASPAIAEIDEFINEWRPSEDNKSQK